MKILIIISLVLCCLFACDDNNNDDSSSTPVNNTNNTNNTNNSNNNNNNNNTNNSTVYEARMNSFEFRNEEYDCQAYGGGDDNTMELIVDPLIFPSTIQAAYFWQSKGSTVYLDGVEQISGVTENDFADAPFIYEVVSQDGKKENVYSLTVEFNPTGNCGFLK